MKWFDNPNPEYTVRVYSKQDLTLVNENGQSNEEVKEEEEEEQASEYETVYSNQTEIDN